MKKINLAFLLFSMCSLVACGYSDEFKEVNHKNEFLISYPDYMEECDDFQADLQYKNSYRNTYSLVNVEDKSGRSLEEFQKEKIAILKGYDLLSKPLVTDSLYQTINNIKSIDIKLYGVMDEENIYYWHTVFEGKDKFYEVVCWTRSMDRKQRYGPDLEKIIASFKPLM